MERRDLLGMVGMGMLVGVQVPAPQAPEEQGRGRGRGRTDPGPPITNTPANVREKFNGMYKLVTSPTSTNPLVWERLPQGK